MLSSNWHVTLRLTVFNIFAVKRLFGGPKTDPLSLFWSRIWWPLKILPPKGEKICHHANFHADRWHLRRYICPRTQRNTQTQWHNYNRFNIRQNAYWCCVGRIKRVSVKNYIHNLKTAQMFDKLKSLSRMLRNKNIIIIINNNKV